MINTDSTMPRGELSVADAALEIWAKRGMVLLVATFVTMIVLAFQFSKFAFSASQKVILPFSLSFLSGSDLTYPNEQSFSKFDIISPAVISQALKEMKLSLSKDGAAEVAEIFLGNEIINASEDQFSSVLRNSELAADIRAQTISELQGMREKTYAYMSLHINIESVGISYSQGVLLAGRILEVWAEQATDKGLMSIDIDQPHELLNVGGDLDVINRYGTASRHLSSLSKSIDLFSEKRGAKSLNFDGLTIYDVKGNLEDLDYFELQPMRQLAYSSSDMLAKAGYLNSANLEAQKRLLQINIDSTVSLIREYDKTLEWIFSYNGSTGSTGASGDKMSNQSGGGRFDQSFLQSMLKLGSSLSLVEARNDLLVKRREAVKNRIADEHELQLISGGGGSGTSVKDVLSTLNSAFPAIVVKINKAHVDYLKLLSMYQELSLQGGSHVYIVEAEASIVGGKVNSVFKVLKFTLLALLVGISLGLSIAVALILLGHRRREG